jgi:hypothetical protein
VNTQIVARRPVDISVTDQQIRQHVTKALMSLRAMLDGDKVLADCAAQQKHIPQLVLAPVERDGKPVCRLSGEMNLTGEGKCVMQRVARDGLEPPPPASSKLLLITLNL